MQNNSPDKARRVPGSLLFPGDPLLLMFPLKSPCLLVHLARPGHRRIHRDLLLFLLETLCVSDLLPVVAVRREACWSLGALIGGILPSLLTV